MKKVFFFILFTLSYLYSQVEVTYDAGIQETMSSYVALNTEEKPQGFRVQICSESGNAAKDVANGEKARFYHIYDDYKAYMVWESPNFKVRVGDFKNRLEANLFWFKIKEDFPASYVVMSEIELYKHN